MTTRDGIGSGYPTGRAPMAFDLSPVIAALTQQNIQAEKQRITEEKTTISENQANILKALDFETIAGLGEQVQLGHMKNVNDLTNKWAERFSQNDGKLSFRDKAELKADQHKVEAKLLTMKTDVEQLKTIQDALTKKQWDNALYPDMDLDATAKAVTEYLPYVGKGQAMQTFKTRELMPYEVAYNIAPELIDNLIKSVSTSFKNVNSKEGMLTAYYSNLQKIKEFADEMMRSNPEFRSAVMKNAAKTNRNPNDVALENMQKLSGIDYYKDMYISGMEANANRASSAESKQKNIDLANKITEGMYSLDENIMRDNIQSLMKISGAKSLKGTTIIEEPDKQLTNVTVRFIDSNDNEKTISFPIMWNPTEEERLLQKQFIFENFVPASLKTGTNGVKMTDIQPNWQIQGHKPVTHERSSKVDAINSALKQMKENNFTKTSKNNFITALEQRFPGKIETKGFTLFTGATEFKFDGEDFNLSNPESVAQLEAKISEMTKLTRGKKPKKFDPNDPDGMFP